MPVIGVFGPTASGKSDVAAAVRELIPAEVVSADAMQVYEGLPILTGAASAEEQRRLEHRLIGFVAVDQTFSAGAYGMAMSSNYNSRPRAAEVLVSGATNRLVRRRETYEDLVRA